MTRMCLSYLGQFYNLILSLLIFVVAAFYLLLGAAVALLLNFRNVHVTNSQTLVGSFFFQITLIRYDKIFTSGRCYERKDNSDMEQIKSNKSFQQPKECRNNSQKYKQKQKKMKQIWRTEV